MYQPGRGRGHVHAQLLAYLPHYGRQRILPGAHAAAGALPAQGVLLARGALSEQYAALPVRYPAADREMEKPLRHRVAAAHGPAGGDAVCVIQVPRLAGDRGVFKAVQAQVCPLRRGAVDGDGVHPRAPGGEYGRRAVVEHGAAPGSHAEPAGREEEDVRLGLAAPHVVGGAERVEPVEYAQPLQAGAVIALRQAGRDRQEHALPAQREQVLRRAGQELDGALILADGQGVPLAEQDVRALAQSEARDGVVRGLGEAARVHLGGVVGRAVQAAAGQALGADSLPQPGGVQQRAVKVKNCGDKVHVFSSFPYFQPGKKAPPHRMRRQNKRRPARKLLPAPALTDRSRGQV